MSGNSDYYSAKDLLAAYASGQREFQNRSFNSKDSLMNENLSHCTFINCLMPVDFRSCDLSHARIINCNIKTADFRGANLSHAVIRGCSVEAVLFTGAVLEEFTFEDNYAHSGLVGQDFFEEHLKDSDDSNRPIDAPKRTAESKHEGLLEKCPWCDGKLRDGVIRGDRWGMDWFDGPLSLFQRIFVGTGQYIGNRFSAQKCDSCDKYLLVKCEHKRRSIFH